MPKLLLLVILSGCVKGGYAPAPNLNFLYTSDSGTNSVSAFSVSSVGTPKELAGSPFTLKAAGQFPYDLAVTPNTQFLYTANYSSNNISAFAISGVNGSLTELQNSPFSGSNTPNPIALVIDKTGSFVYVVTGANNISAFAVNQATGALTELAQSPYTVQGVNPAPYFEIIDKTNTFLYVSNSNTNTISAYTINSQTGALTLVPGSPFGLPGNYPVCLAIDPSNRFLFSADNYSNTASAFTINAATGALTAVPGSPFSTSIVNGQPYGAEVDLTGNFFYITDFNTNQISIFKINGSSGALTQISGSPVSVHGTNPNPMGVSLDPSGNFFYAANSNTNTISTYTLNLSSGLLSEVSGSPFILAGSNPGPTNFQFVSIAQPR